MEALEAMYPNPDQVARHVRGGPRGAVRGAQGALRLRGAGAQDLLKGSPVASAQKASSRYTERVRRVFVYAQRSQDLLTCSQCSFGSPVCHDAEPGAPAQARRGAQSSKQQPRHEGSKLALPPTVRT